MTEIGEIPVEWETFKLGSVRVSLYVKSGSTPSKKYKDYWNGGIPFVKQSDMTNVDHYLLETSEKITELAVKGSNLTLIPKNSILISMYGTIGKVVINEIPITVSQNIAAIVLNNKNVNEEYIYYAIKQYSSQFKVQAKTITLSHLDNKIVKNAIIPIPSLAEQRRIAEILSTTDETIQKVNEEITLNEKLKKGLMQTLLTKGIGHTKFKITGIGEIPEDWGVKTIQEVAIVKYGRSNPKTKGNIPLIGSSGVFGTVDEALIQTPTIVIGRKGTAGAVWDIRTPSWPSDTSFYLEYKNEISQKFLFEFMSLNKLTGKNAMTTLPSIKREEIEEFLFPLPPIIEQKRISDILTEVDHKLELLRIKKTYLERIKKGLMSDLLTGKVRVNINTSQGKD